MEHKGGAELTFKVAVGEVSLRDPRNANATVCLTAPIDTGLEVVDIFPCEIVSWIVDFALDLVELLR